ncbi:MAG: hypothetical protein JST92_27610, partial [Deltaproteobacteria bacterium]|nr:hypothetical protein [Deltaproteobacteria bacterium]
TPAPTAAQVAGAPAATPAPEKESGGERAAKQAEHKTPPMTMPPLSPAPDAQPEPKAEAKDEKDAKAEDKKSDEKKSDEKGLFDGFISAGSPALDAPGGIAAAAQVPATPLQLSGFVILNGQWIQEDPNYVYVGRTNGFSLSEARLEVTGRVTQSLWMFLSLDGAVQSRQGADPSQGKNIVDLKDAYFVWEPITHLRIQGGQFKAPQDGENLMEETEVRFPTRSIVTAGVNPPEGYTAVGLAVGRQVGLAVGTDQINFPYGWIAGQAMVSNGNGPNQLVNDTKIPSFTGRVAAGFLSNHINVGVDGYYQPRGTGTLQQYYRDDLYGFGADLTFNWGPAHVMGLVQSRLTKHVTAGSPDEQSLGFMAEAGWKFLGHIEPVIRFAQLDPSDLVPLAKVAQLDVGLNLYVKKYGRLSLAYVHRMEQTGRDLTNDGLDLSLQVRF